MTRSWPRRFAPLPRTKTIDSPSGVRELGINPFAKFVNILHADRLLEAENVRLQRPRQHVLLGLLQQSLVGSYNPVHLGPPRICRYEHSHGLGRDLDLAPEALWYLEEPLGQMESVQMLLNYEEAAKHVKVLLVGEGADELFAGYPRYKAVWLANQFDRLFRELNVESYRPLPTIEEGYATILNSPPDAIPHRHHLPICPVLL